MNREALIKLLPPEKGEERVIRKRQGMGDIVQEVLDAHQDFAGDYDQICAKFAGQGVERRLYDFCRRQLAYKVEKGKQSTRSPAVLMRMGSCDCKGYAGFINGVLDGLNRAGLGRYDWCYRFALYNEDPDASGHVFAVVKKPSGGEIWIDPVLDELNKRTPEPLEYIDETVTTMPLVRMSGVLDPRPRTVPVSRRGAAIAGPLQGYGSARVGFAPNPQLTADQQGIPIMQAAFNHWGSEYPGAAAWLASNPPYRFMLGGEQLILPPAVQSGGQPVPPMPDGIYLQWDSNFMGHPIPADMLNVNTKGNALTVWPLEVMSAGGTGSQTNNLLYNTNRYLGFLFLSALENLIYSYSSYPWGNQWNDLSQQLNSSRNYSNWLVYPKTGQKTWLGNLLQQASKVETAVAPVLETVANVAVPGSGALIAAGTSLAASATGSNSNVPPGSQLVNTYIPVSAQTVAAPGSSGVSLTDVGQSVSQFVQSNPVLSAGIAAGVALILYELFD